MATWLMKMKKWRLRERGGPPRASQAGQESKDSCLDPNGSQGHAFNNYLLGNAPLLQSGGRALGGSRHLYLCWVTGPADGWLDAITQ